MASDELSSTYSYYNGMNGYTRTANKLRITVTLTLSLFHDSFVGNNEFHIVYTRSLDQRPQQRQSFINGYADYGWYRRAVAKCSLTRFRLTPKLEQKFNTLACVDIPRNFRETFIHRCLVSFTRFLTIRFSQCPKD